MDDQWAALQWQKKTGRAVVISPHGMLDPWAVKNSAWKKKLVGWFFASESLRRATCIHALCESEAESIRAYGLTNPIAVIPNGIDLPETGCRKSAVGDQQEQKRKILFLGRIHPKKGLKELIEAWSRLGEKRAQWQLLIAGWDDGGHLERLKKQASEFGLRWRDLSQQTFNLDTPTFDICFLGPKFGEEKHQLLQSVDGFILPSFSEGLPMSVLEAWAYGLPVIMTEFCNIPEGFAAQAAIRVEPRPESIAEGLESFFSLADEERGAIGECGRRLVEERFTWDSIARQMKAVYEWCLTGKNPPSCMRFD
jgi:poly(glycerol-phosphate) alpha-glucosyltransferase